MRRIYKMQGLGCAHCASKIEHAIKKIDGVNDVHVNFITQKLTLDADENRFESILNEVNRACTKFEPDVVILCQS